MMGVFDMTRIFKHEMVLSSGKTCPDGSMSWQA